MEYQNLIIKIMTKKNGCGVLGVSNCMSIDTQIKVPKEMQYYYLADSYDTPTKVRLIDYNICQSVDNIILILASVLNLKDGTWKEVFIEDLYDTKNKASDAYMENKYK